MNKEIQPVNETSGNLTNAEKSMMVNINYDQCGTVSLRLTKLKLGPFRLPAHEDLLPFKSDERNLNYLFLMCTLLFDLKGLGGKVGKKWLHGSEYLFAAMREKTQRNPDLFDPTILATISTKKFDSFLSRIGNNRNHFNTRSLERAEILKDAAHKLVYHYQGKVSNLLDSSEGLLVQDNSKGLIQLMQRFRGYSDPHFKKGFVFLKFVTKLGFFEPIDKKNLYVPVDYHVMRVALRAGIIEIVDENLKEKLTNKMPASAEEDFQIRESVKNALKMIERTSSFDAFDLDDILWNIGRSHCHYSHEPMCSTCPGIQCTFESLLNFICQGECLLNGVCKGSLSEAYKKLLEPSLRTTYY